MSQVWLIAGSSRGLGRHLANAVLGAGHELVATARRVEDLSDLIAQYPERVRAVALDVTDEAAASQAVQAAVSVFGRLDVVVNNAGYANVNSFEDLPAPDFRAQMDTNFFGVVNVTRAADAVAIAAAELSQRAREDAQWRDVSMSTDFDGLQAFGETAVGQFHLN